MRLAGSNARLADGFQPRRDLVERLLNAIELHLSCFCELLNALRRPLQMACNIPNDLAAPVAEEKHAKSSQQHSQAAQAVCELFVFVHSPSGPHFQDARRQYPAEKYDAAQRLDAKRK